MKKYIILLGTILFSLYGCGQPEVAYTTHESADGVYRIDIPSKWGNPRVIADVMQIVGGESDPMVNIMRVPYTSLSDYLNSGDAFSQGETKRKFDYTIKDRTDNLVAYKITTPTTFMFSACSVFGFKRLNSGNYVINVMAVNGEMGYLKQIVQHMIDSLQDED